MSKKKSKAKDKDAPKLTKIQSRFAKAFMEARTITEAALMTEGLSKKNPGQSGFQILESLKKKRVPEIMEALGLSVPELIEKHLKPQLNANEVKFAQEEGEFTDYVELPALDIRDRALDKAFRLHGAYAPKDPETAAQVGVKVIIMDMPRPQMDLVMDDVRPGPLVPKRLSGKTNGSGNGSK